MSSIFSLEVTKNENEWFFQQTNLFNRTNSVKYNIAKNQIHSLKEQYYGTKSTITNNSNMHNESATLEFIMRKCFKKCNKFVLEDWIDYNELDCSLKCSVVQKDALKILQNKEYL